MGRFIQGQKVPAGTPGKISCPAKWFHGSSWYVEGSGKPSWPHRFVTDLPICRFGGLPSNRLRVPECCGGTTIEHPGSQTSTQSTGQPASHAAHPRLENSGSSTPPEAAPGGGPGEPRGGGGAGPGWMMPRQCRQQLLWKWPRASLVAKGIGGSLTDAVSDSNVLCRCSSAWVHC